MSMLRPIIEQLNRERATRHTFTAEEGGGQECVQGLRSSPLGCHATWYRENLSHCSEAMLQYEWAWMNGRIDALEHCRHEEGSPAGDQDTGPEAARLADLLSESQLFLTLLLREFAGRGLRPSAAKGTVIPSEEAWEITSLQVKQDWGIV
jgi:hypothetical protein